MGRSSIHGIPVWFSSSFNLVGVLVGYYGTCDVLCGLRHSDDILCIFCNYQTGKLVQVLIQQLLFSNSIVVLFNFQFFECLLNNSGKNEFLIVSKNGNCMGNFPILHILLSHTTSSLSYLIYLHFMDQPLGTNLGVVTIVILFLTS